MPNARLKLTKSAVEKLCLPPEEGETNSNGKPINALTYWDTELKGFGLGEAGEGQNVAHQQKKMDLDALRAFRDRFNIPIADKDLDDVPFYRPAADSEELEYLHERRQALGGYLPARRTSGPSGKKFMLMPPAVWFGGRPRSCKTYWSTRWSRLCLCVGRNTTGWRSSRAAMPRSASAS